MNDIKGKNVIKLIEQNNQGKLIINNVALKFIQNLNDHVGVIVAVGKKRLGKSFMLNRLGLESKESSKEWDCKIFVLSLLMSSYLIYNTNGTYTRDDLEKLSLVTKISENIRKNSSSEMDKNDFPELLWVCRDYKFEIKNDDAGRDGLKEFMKTHFETDNLNKTKDFFIKSFKNIDGFYLPYPDLEHKNEEFFSELHEFMNSVEKRNELIYESSFFFRINEFIEKTRNECFDELKKKIEKSYLKEY
ncbi:guanylate-binding 6 [Brachionus plicatilis]|uniref:Guanylate-binding 6 n=1 Tax=Brachionus plicatilis TaxID=10195 RepID=A0A3M7T976_BRAPC|nr:guanylate-binding 6 [Brachionus plicatilis]